MSYKSTRPVSVNKSKGHCWWTGCAWPILLVFCLLQVFFVIYYLILCYLPREGLLMERNNIRFIYSCSICYRRQYKHGITHFCHLISLSAALYNLIHEQVLPNNIKSDKRCRNNLHRPTHVKIQIKIPIKFRIYTKPDNTSSSYYLLPTVSLTFPWSRIKYYKLKCISSDNNFPNTHFTKAHFFTKGLNRFYVFFFFSSLALSHLCFSSVHTLISRFVSSAAFGFYGAVKKQKPRRLSPPPALLQDGIEFSE